MQLALRYPRSPEFHPRLQLPIPKATLSQLAFLIPFKCGKEDDEGARVDGVAEELYEGEKRKARAVVCI